MIYLIDPYCYIIANKLPGMPTSKGKTQIQVDLETRDALKTLKGVRGYSSYDELIWSMVKKSEYDKILEATNALKEEIEKQKDKMEEVGIVVDTSNIRIRTKEESEKDELEYANIDWKYNEKTGHHYGFKDDNIIIWNKKNNSKIIMNYEDFLLLQKERFKK